jgi:hypothetical protein
MRRQEAIEEDSKYEEKESSRSWRHLPDEEHDNIYSVPDIVRVVKSRRMRWIGRVAHMENL